MWYEFCFGTTMGSGDIEGVVMQGNSSARQNQHAKWTPDTNFAETW